MRDLNDDAFISLFKDAYQKCFGAPLAVPSSETESRRLSNKIFEATGLVIGAKSLKNYSQYVIDDNDAKPENPSVATLDTLARYVLNAPYTSEIQRKDNESHYPYWFQYKGSLKKYPSNNDRPPNVIEKKKRNLLFPVLITAIIIAAIAVFLIAGNKNEGSFKENFHTLNEDTLMLHGWQIKNKDTTWWNKRNEKPSFLTLYTLRGDNWADSANRPAIKNMLIKKLPSDCFEAEIHFENFLPKQKWQQAGILLLEDTSLTSKSLRLSFAFNDFFGGYNKPKEIIVQAISSDGTDLSKPEEIAHLNVSNFEGDNEQLNVQNLEKSALKIIKTGSHYRCLYGIGSRANFAYKEALSKDLDIQPKYIAIFALQGFVKQSGIMPVHIKFFSLSELACKN